MLREFSYLFTYSRRFENYSTLARFIFPSSIIILLFTSMHISRNLIVEVYMYTSIFLVELIMASHIRGVRSIINGLKLIISFIIVGSIVFYISSLLGWLSPDPFRIIPGALRLVAFFTALVLFFQVITIREWRRIFNALGLKKQSMLFSMIMLQIPTTMYYLSEAATTIRLKYKGKKIHKIVVPLILLSLYTSRSMIESYVLYGVSLESKLTLFKKKDIFIYTLLLTVTILVIFGALV